MKFGDGPLKWAQGYSKDNPNFWCELQNGKLSLKLTAILTSYNESQEQQGKTLEKLVLQQVLGNCELPTRVREYLASMKFLTMIALESHRYRMVYHSQFW